MSSRNILIVYGTTYGQTARIADRMADVLMRDGDRVTVVHAHDRWLPGNHTFREFDGVIVGASVIRGKHQRTIRRFVRVNRLRLDALPTAFFSVSGAAGSAKPKDRARAAGFIREFRAESDWRPALTGAIGGTLAYTKYNPLLRWMMKSISQREGGPTDTSRDHELTDWEQVDRFARAFAALVPAQPAPFTPVAA